MTAYVYVLFRPNGHPFYVGKGTGRRWLKHEWRSHNPHVSAIIKQAGGQVPRVKIRDGLTESEALAIEIALIAAIGRECDGGPLVNLTDGGEGKEGHIVSAETRAKMSVSQKGKRLGMTHSEDACARIRAARTGSRASAETRAKMSAAHARRGPVSAETRAKQSAAVSGDKHGMFGRHHTLESKAKISAGTKGLKKSAETRARMSAAQFRRRANAS